MNIKFLNVVNLTNLMLENSCSNNFNDEDINDVLTRLTILNKQSFDQCTQFYDEHREQITCFILNMNKLISKSEYFSNGLILKSLKEEYETFLETKNMISEFKEIYDILIPNIKSELVSEGKELNKLVAFSCIDISQQRCFKNDHNLDSLLELSKKGGNVLFFNRAGRNSTISEKRLSTLSTDTQSSGNEKRKSMPLFLNQRDMMIFDDFLEIEKLNDALFKSLREFLSEKIDSFNNKYNSCSLVFADMITSIKNRYLELDEMFEQLSLSLKKFENKITVENWHSALSEMFDNCMEYIELHFNKVERINLVDLNEQIMIINKHILLFNNLLDISWNEQLYDEVKVFRNALQFAWSKAKSKHNIIEKFCVIDDDKSEAPKTKNMEKTKVSSIANEDEKTEKPIVTHKKLSRDDKRRSIGTALFQKMNLRASLIQDFNDSNIEGSTELLEEDEEHTEIEKHDNLSMNNLQKTFSLQDIRPHLFDDNSARHSELNLTRMSVDSFNEFGDSTLNDLSILSTYQRLEVSFKTVLKFSKQKTKIPVSDLTLFYNDSTFDIDLSLVQLKSLEESLDRKRAELLCHLVKTESFHPMKVKNVFTECKPLKL
ncbi:hypothetical protein ACO0OL_004035 [Hanseniaspora opuntiae]